MDKIRSIGGETENYMQILIILVREYARRRVSAVRASFIAVTAHF